MEDQKKERILIMSEDTGEILDIKEKRPADRLKVSLQTEEQILAAKKKQDMTAWEKGPFAKVFMPMIPYLKRELTGNEWMFCTTIMPFVCYQDCILRKGGKSNGEFVKDFKEISEMSGYTYSQTCRYMRNLISKQVIICAYTGKGPSRITVYLMNPYILMKGVSIKDSVIRCFENTCWARYNDEAIGKVVPDVDLTLK